MPMKLNIGTGPRDCITIHIGNGNDSIIEGGLNMSHTFVNIFTLFAFYTPSSF